VTENDLPSGRTPEPYEGFEQGPIRPPSEAQSLLIRVTRNCPWNRCAFCPVYKGTKFSLRPVEHVLMDIDTVHRHVVRLCAAAEDAGGLGRAQVQALAAQTPRGEVDAFQAALRWHLSGMRAVFLQDANSLIMKPADLVRVLEHLRACFPGIARVTSYARAHTVAARRDTDLKMLADAGLNRVHIGLESGSDEVLSRMQKGVTKAGHITAGRKIVAAGIELSEYYMPGLGGREWSREHAIESADALNQINPHFIRIRTLAIPGHVPLHEQWIAGQFQKCTDLEMAAELALFLERLEGIRSVIKSDHILNLFEEVQGTLPEDRPRMLETLRAFLALDPEHRMLYQLGRRLGLLSRLADLGDPHRIAAVEQSRRQFGVTPENVDEIIDNLMRQFI
jgi:biotin synthase-like enzyme